LAVPVLFTSRSAGEAGGVDDPIKKTGAALLVLAISIRSDSAAQLAVIIHVSYGEKLLYIGTEIFFKKMR
jgi:hypothetical protein